MAEVYPGPIETACHIAILDDPMAFKAVKGWNVLFWTRALIMKIRARGGSRHELETAVAFWQDLVINEDAAVVDSAEDVLFWAV